MKRIRLGVNVDHVATLRQQRDTMFPDPVYAAAIAEEAGADQITIHLREDRRHIQDRDLEILRRTVATVLNLEMADTEEMLGIAERTRPDTVTLVPERREERTTEGGLDVVNHAGSLEKAVGRLRASDIAASLFIDPDPAQVRASAAVGAQIIELHTGDYCEAPSAERDEHLRRLQEASTLAADLGLVVAAGHGIDYHNVDAIAAIPECEELNIGHSIVCRAVFVGFANAVREMIERMERARRGGGAA